MPFPGTTLVPLAFDGGLQSKIAKFSLPSPHLEDAENCRYTLYGQIEKRTGFTSLSRNVMGGGVISSGKAVQSFNGELVLFDGRKLYSWQDDEDVWVDKGSAFSVSTSQTRVLNTKIATQSHPDACVTNDIALFVWEDNRAGGGEGTRYTVIDQSTGMLVVSDALMYSSALRCKSVPYHGVFVSTYETDSQSIWVSFIDSTRPNILSGPQPLVTDGQPVTPATQTIPYDLTNGGPDDQVFLAYASTTGLFAKSYQPTYGAPNNTRNALVDPSTTVQCVAISNVSTGVIWVVWSDATNTYAQQLNGTLFPVGPQFIVQAQPSVNISIAGLHNSAGTAVISCEVAGVAAFGNYVNVYSAAASVTYMGQQRGAGLAAKSFVQDTDTFAVFVYASSLQATYFTVCLTSPLGSAGNPVSGAIGGTGFEVVAKHSPTNAGGYRTNGLLSECQPKSIDVLLFAGQRKGPFTSYATSQGTVLGVAGYTCGFDQPNQFNSVVSSNNMHIAGGVKKVYDGVSVVEDNFHVWPELLALPAGATFPATFAGNGCSATLSAGGGLSPSSSYEYFIVYSWPDNYGQVQRSGVSVGTIVTTGGGPDLLATLTIPTLRLTDKLSDRSPVSIDVYRTQANLSVPYKLTSDASPLVNDLTVDFVTFVDAATDVSIGANENLYTGSQLSNIAPPACEIITLFQNRLAINQNEDPGVVWYSQNKFDLSQYNTLPLDWNTSFVEGVDSRAGANVTALGLLDASLAIFKPTAIYLLSGSGPNTLFTAGEFNDAQLLVSDTGCTNQNSLAFVTQTQKSPGGLLFKSAKGIYLLGRDSSLTYVGAPVEEFNDLTIVSADILSQTNEIVFSTAEGTALVYNYFFDTWTTWHDLPAVDAIEWQGQLAILKADGTVMVQDGTHTVWKDTGSNGLVRQIQRKVTTPWIVMRPASSVPGLPAGPPMGLGFQAVYNCTLLGQFAGPHTMTIQVRYDYNPSVVETVTWNGNLSGNTWGGLPIWGTVQGNWGNTNFSTYEFQINFQNPRCQAIQLTFIDGSLTDADNNVTYSEGSILNGLALETLALPGPARLPTSHTVGSTGYPR